MADYTINNLNQAAWLVYINGLEIPTPRVEVHFGVWTMPTATIQLVPHTMLQRIGAEDRLQVVIFYLDTTWEPENPQFCLFGEFEVVGWTYTNMASGRFIQLECVSQLQILEQLKFYYMSSINDMAAAGGGVLDTEIKETSVLYPTSLFQYGLTPTTKASEAGPGAFIKRPIEFVLNLFKALTAPIAKGDPKSTVPGPDEVSKLASSLPSRNFFTRWLTMTKFNRKWAALPVLEDITNSNDSCFPILKAAQDTQTMGALQTHLGGDVGFSGSAWDLLKMVYSYMYMEVATIPCPPAAQVDKQTFNISGTMKPPAKGEAKDFLSVVSFFVKPQCVFALPPTCNVVFPCMIQNYTFNENYIMQPTRLYLGENFLSGKLTGSSTSAGLESITKNALTTGYPPPIQKRLKQNTDFPSKNSFNLLLFPEEFFKGPVTTRLNAPPWLFLLSQQQSANASVSENVEGQMQLGNVFNQYAEYEYNRSRFAYRNGGLSLAWDPYIVPGFPAMVFDQQTNGFDTMGYVNDVTHVMSAGGGNASLTTQIGLTFMRTTPEFVDILADPVYPPVTSQVTDDSVAQNVVAVARINFEDALNSLLVDEIAWYKDRWETAKAGGLSIEESGGANYAKIDKMSASVSNYADAAALDSFIATLNVATTSSYVEKVRTAYTAYTDAVKALEAMGSTPNPVVTTPDVQYDIAPTEATPDVRNTFQLLGNANEVYRRLFFQGTANLARTTVFNWQAMADLKDSKGNVVKLVKGSTFDSTVSLEPKAKYQPLFDSYNAAMKYVSRPVCTLREYVEMWHNKPIKELLDSKVVEGPDTSFYGGVGGNGAVYWARIYTLRPGPGAMPDTRLTNVGPAPNYEPIPQATGWKSIVDEDKFPQTRQDWNKILLEYRRIIRSDDGRVSFQL